MKRWNTIEGFEPRDVATLLARETHADALAISAATALRRGRHRAAFLLADRRCRMDVPEPEHLLLRADAARSLGEHAQALADVERALAIDPDHLFALRRALAWGAEELRRDAAARLLVCEDDIDTLVTAIRAVAADGIDGVAVFKPSDKNIEAWMAWREPAQFQLRVAWRDDESIYEIAAQPAHPLARALGYAASIGIDASPGVRSAEPEIADARIRMFGVPVRLRGTTAEPGDHAGAAADGSKPDQSGVSVIIPVYEDAVATAACLSSVLRAAETALPREIIVVDDCSPNPEIKALLVKLDAEAKVRLITHAVNLGFVDSVNHALAERRYVDAVLLNSDTVVPPGALDRLVATLRSADDIATATPLSNNGEFTSFPEGFVANELPSDAEIGRIDAAARRVNSGRAIDVPNGIGFCMAIRGACLERLGAFETAVELGYLEDVDFCLKAAEAGYRNVCAADVYVGHKGSSSFKERKRSLVMKNMPLIQHRYPRYRAACAAFIRVDPLQPARARVEEALLADRAEAFELVAIARGRDDDPARGRIDELLSQGTHVLVAGVDGPADAPIIRLFRPDAGLPKNIVFRCERPEDLSSVMAFLKRLRVDRIEFIDPAAVPVPVQRAFLALGRPHDVWMSTAFDAARHPPISELAASARRVAYSSPDLAELLGRREDVEDLTVATNTGGARKKLRLARACCIGVVPLDASAQTLSFLCGLARSLRRITEDIDLAVLGATCDDRQLLAAGNCFVTGPLPPAELRPMLAAIKPAGLLLLNRRPVFGHALEAEAMASGLPLARFDWLGEARAVSGEDRLPLSPRLEASEVATSLATWCREISEPPLPPVREKIAS